MAENLVSSQWFSRLRNLTAPSKFTRQTLYTNICILFQFTVHWIELYELHYASYLRRHWTDSVFVWTCILLSSTTGERYVLVIIAVWNRCHQKPRFDDQCHCQLINIFEYEWMNEWTPANNSCILYRWWQWWNTLTVTLNDLHMTFAEFFYRTEQWQLRQHTKCQRQKISKNVPTGCCTENCWDFCRQQNNRIIIIYINHMQSNKYQAQQMAMAYISYVMARSMQQ